MIQTGLHSMSYAGTWGGAALGLEEFVDHAAELGFEGVMLMAKRPHASPLDLPPERVASLKRRVAAAGIEVVSIAGSNDFTATIGHDQIANYPSGVPLLELQLLHIRKCAELAHDLEAPFVRVFTGYEHPGLTSEGAWRTTVDSIAACADYAAALGVTLAVQNHHDVGNHHQTLRSLVEEIDRSNVRAAYDAWASALQGLSAFELETSAVELAPLTAYTTVADYELQPRFHYEPRLLNFLPQTPAARAVPMGEGVIAYDAFFRGLVAGGFDGFAIYEMCSPLIGGGSAENLDRYARRFLDWTRRTAVELESRTSEAVPR